MTLNFKIFYPGGNTTGLLEQPIKASLRASIAKKIMKRFPKIEQVGFVSRFKLEMMGNELCINAAQCAALNWQLSGKGNDLSFKIPGLKNKIAAKVRKNNVVLRLPKSIVLSARKTADGHLVDMQGIRYLISNKKLNSLAFIKQQLKKYIGSFPAIGFIQIKKTAGLIAINPWVWVKATNTLVHETACGSGSIAAALVFKASRIKQPSGSIYKIKFDQKNILIEAEVKYLGLKTI